MTDLVQISALEPSACWPSRDRGLMAACGGWAAAEGTGDPGSLKLAKERPGELIDRARLAAPGKVRSR